MKASSHQLCPIRFSLSDNEDAPLRWRRRIVDFVCRRICVSTRCTQSVAVADSQNNLARHNVFTNNSEAETVELYFGVNFLSKSFRFRSPSSGSSTSKTLETTASQKCGRKPKSSPSGKARCQEGERHQYRQRARRTWGKTTVCASRNTPMIAVKLAKVVVHRREEFRRPSPPGHLQAQGQNVCTKCAHKTVACSP